MRDILQQIASRCATRACATLIRESLGNDRTLQFPLTSDDLTMGMRFALNSI
jgi:hypothetical protein